MDWNEECRGCEFLGPEGCGYKSFMGRSLPCPPGRGCHFNPRQPARNSKGNLYKNYTKKEIEEMPVKVSFDETKARQMYDERKSDAVIASELGVSTTTIQRWRANNKLPAHALRKETVELCGPKITPEEIVQEAAALTLTPEEKMNIAVVTASNIAQKAVLNAGLITAAENGPHWLLQKMLNENPVAEICADGLPIKAVVVLTEYDLRGEALRSQINLCTE